MGHKVVFTNEQWELLEKVADAKGITTVTQLVRLMVRFCLQDHLLNMLFPYGEPIKRKEVEKLG